MKQGFKYSHLTNEPAEQEIKQPISITNSHILLYGVSGSGMTSFLNYYLD